MWECGRERLSAKDKQLAKRVRRGPPTVSARHIPPHEPQDHGATFLSPTLWCTRVVFTAWWYGESEASVFAVFVRKVSRR